MTGERSAHFEVRVAGAPEYPRGHAPRAGREEP